MDKATKAPPTDWSKRFDGLWVMGREAARIITPRAATKSRVTISASIEYLSALPGPLVIFEGVAAPVALSPGQMEMAV